MELPGIVKRQDLMRLFGEVVFGFGEESKMVISKEDVFKVGNAVGLGLNMFGPRAFLLLPLLPEFLGDFSLEEGSGELETRTKS